ncbi:MAG: hypothetical protein JST00_13775 [Deltaproteobacteria bacterium]|nr:hypothetical protein [Deltaproteobacteria bacterium]
MQLPRHWLTAGSNDWLWGSGQTYKVIPYEALPRIEGLEGSFSWLDRGPTLEDALAFQEQPRPPFAARVLEAQRAGLDVPSEALRFLQDAALHGRVRSCTSCYLELGSRLVPLSDHDGPERLLRGLVSDASD